MTVLDGDASTPKFLNYLRRHYVFHLNASPFRQQVAKTDKSNTMYAAQQDLIFTAAVQQQVA